ncbi:hypothetical protein BH23ACT2_BH23ACT2_20510 [soil metagenome]
MAITEETRHHLHQRLEAVLGPEEAASLMEHLPPRGWGDVATKVDLDHLQTVTKQDLDLAIERLRTELKGDIAELRAEIGAVRTEMVQMGAALQERIDANHASLLASMAELRAEMHEDRRAGQRQVIGALVVALIAVVMTVAGLG